MKTVKKFVLIPLILCSLLLTSCSGAAIAEDSFDRVTTNGNKYFSEESAMAPGSAAMDYEYAYDSKMEMETAAPSEAPKQESGTSENDLGARKIIRTANLQYETKEYDRFIEEIQAAIRQCGGYIQTSESRGQGVNKYSTRYAHYTVRIPAAQYDVFMSLPTEYGVQTYKNETVDDKTMEYVDIESHIKALETEYASLLAILEKATSLDDVIQLQSRITQVNYQLDSYKSQLRKYDDLIAYCTVYININEVYRETQNVVAMSFGEKIVSGLKNTFLDIGDDMSEFTIWFVTSLPYIVIWVAMIAAAVVVIRIAVRRIRRKREIKKIDKMIQNANENETNPRENS